MNLSNEPQHGMSGVEKKLVFRICSNIAIIVIEIILILNTSLSWMKANYNMTIETFDMQMFSLSIPAYLKASFNDEPPPKEYLKQIIFNKPAIPGDIISLSVFINLGYVKSHQVTISAIGLPGYFQYLDDSATFSYADIINEDNDALTIINNSNPCYVEIESYEHDSESAVLKITLTLPDGYENGGNGLWIDFNVYFSEENVNQNVHMGEKIDLSFKAE